MGDEPELIIQGELGPGERLLWAGRPPVGLMLRAVDALLIPLSLIPVGFAILWLTMAFRFGPPFFVALGGVPFLLVGLYFAFGRFFVEAWQRANMCYGVTSKRVVISSGLFGRKVKSLNLDTLTDVSLTVRGNGSGTITFGPVSPPPYWWCMGGEWWPGMEHRTAPSFELLSDARQVYEIVGSAQRAKRQPN